MGSGEDAAALLESAAEEALDLVLDDLDFLLNQAVFIVWISREQQGFSKVEVIFDGEGEEAEGTEEGEGGGDGEGGDAEEACEGFEVVEGGGLFFGADDADGDDGEVVLEGEAHEAEAEVLELVGFVVGLADAADAFGEDEDGGADLGEESEVVACAEDLSGAREEPGDEGE